MKSFLYYWSENFKFSYLSVYEVFNKSLANALKEYGMGGDFNEAMSKVMGFESEQEFNSVMYSLSDSQ